MNIFGLGRLAVLCSVIIIASIAGSERLPGKNRGGYVTVDYLAWKAQEDQLQYVVNIPGGLPDVAPVTLSQYIVEPCFNFRSGVRVELGYFFCNDWDIWASWTHLHERTRCENIAADTLVATPLSNIIGSPVVLANAAHNRFTLHFDTMSLNVGKYFIPSDGITLEPFMGIKGARIYQRQKINYEGMTLFGTPLAPTPADRRNNFAGIGPTIGAQCIWNLGSSDWSLFGSVSGALLAGRFCTSIFNALILEAEITGEATVDVLQLQPLELRDVDAIDPTPIISDTLRQRKCSVRSEADMQVGIGWEHEFSHGPALQFRVAFEAQIWPNQWQVFSSIGNVTQSAFPGGGDLTLYGATLGVGLLF